MSQKTYKHILFVLFSYIFFVSFAMCANKSSTGNQNSSDTIEPKIRLIDPIYTEIKENKIIYKGFGLSAEYFGEAHPGIVVKPYIEGLIKDGESFSVSADMGYYDVRKHVITLDNNIIAVLNNNYTLKSNEVEYFINKKLILSEKPITIYGKDLQLYGDRGSIDLEKNLIIVKGNINAKIYKVRLR